MDFNNYNVNIKLPADKAMRLMSILVLCQISFEEQRSKICQDALLKEDLEGLNEVIDLCKFAMEEIDKAIINSIDEISHQDRKERFNSMIDEIKSKLGGK